MTIIVVRHGETALNAARVVQPADTPLNQRGVRQADLVAPRLGAMEPVHILCSDLERTRMTAQPLERLTGLQAELSPLLQERNFGDIRGRPYAELGAEIFRDDYAPPNGETWDVFHARIDRAWTMVVERRAQLGGNLIVVTHGLVCRSLVERHLTRTDGEGPLRWRNTSVTVAEADAPHSVSMLNDVEHLQGEVDLDGAPV